MEECLNLIERFHGWKAPGLVLGLFMVDWAQEVVGTDRESDAIVETSHCLPDAVQLLTPCTVGNGWLRIIDLGRFALSLFEKYTGNGVRVYVDSRKLGDWPELKAFFFKLKPKKEQDFEALMAEVRLAQASIFGLQEVMVDLDSVKIHHRDAFAVCPLCGEGYPEDDGEVCLGCQGEAPYLQCEAQGLQED